MTEKIQETHEETEAPLEEISEQAEEPKKAKREIPPLVLIAVMAISLIVILLIQFLPKPEPKWNNEIQTLRAELEERRAELNRQKARFEGNNASTFADSAETLSERISQDLKTMTTMNQNYEKIIIENQSEITALKAETERAERRYREILEENSVLQKQNRNATNSSEELKMIEMEWKKAERENTQLKEQLSRSKEQISTLDQGVSSEEIEDLKRRLEETSRAKDFFENQVKDLQKSFPR